MSSKADIPLALIKTAGITGISLVWANFTVKAFKMACHIFSTSLEEETLLKKDSFHCNYCGRYFQGDDNSIRWVLCQKVYLCDDCAEREVACEECQKHFLMTEMNWNMKGSYVRIAANAIEKIFSENISSCLTTSL